MNQLNNLPGVGFGLPSTAIEGSTPQEGGLFDYTSFAQQIPVYDDMLLDKQQAASKIASDIQQLSVLLSAGNGLEKTEIMSGTKGFIDDILLVLHGQAIQGTSDLIVDFAETKLPDLGPVTDIVVQMGVIFELNIAITSNALEIKIGNNFGNAIYNSGLYQNMILYAGGLINK